MKPIQLIALLLLLLLTGCGEPPKSLEQLPSDAVILAFGDSLTYGTGATAKNDYPSILAKLTARKVINEGRPGEISRDGLKRLPSLLDHYQPDLLILIHGGNDILRRIPVQHTLENLKQMIVLCKSRNIEVILLGVPKPNVFLLSSADFYQTLADSSDVVADLDTLPDILGNNELKSDLIHPNDAGYRLMAENIHQLLLQAGALSTSTGSTL
ncbi:MAG: GDSL-type esterase/lipase family protein [Gammaproteobacteria bacterium]